MSYVGVAATPARRLSPLLLRRGRLSRRHAGDATNTTRSMMSTAAAAGGSSSGGGSDGTPARSYEAALELLATLQSNRAVTSLFTSPPPPPPPDVTAPATATTATTPGKTDLNAQAIPEMRQWLGRAGLSPACDDLAAAGMLCVHVAGTKGKGSVCAYLTSILTQPELSLVTTTTTTTADGVGGGSKTAAAAASAEGQEKTKKQAIVGTYTSPHLVSVRERIQVGGRPLPPERFARYFFEVWDAMSASARAELEAKDHDNNNNNSKDNDSSGDDAKRQGRQQGQQQLLTAGEREAREAEICGPASKPFYFRFLTVLALHAFLREGVTAAVVECGIGGEHDSTNVLPASCVSASVVAQLGVDHVGMLGGTLPEIAWHKAGVCKAGRKCFTLRLGDDDDGLRKKGEAGATMAVLRRRAAEKGAQLCEIDDGQIDGLIGRERDRDGPGQEAEVLGREEGFGVGSNNPSLQGDFQRYNQALAAAAAREHLRVAAGLGEPLPEWEPAIRRGLREARLRGRCETRPDDGAHGAAGLTWHIDGAHTAESLAGVARWFAQQQRPGPKQQPQHLQGQQDGKTLSSQVETAPVRRVLVFNQQERDAGRLLSGMLEAAVVRRGDGPAEQGKGGKEGLFFDAAIFTRNEEVGASAGDGDERDLSVQRAGEQVMRELSPGTATCVVDNVGSAVREARAQAAGAGAARTLVLVTGSLHLVGALLRTLEPDAPP